MVYNKTVRDAKGRFIKGYKPAWTKESRKKVSESMRGVNTWMKGRKLPEKTRANMSRNNARYWTGKKRLDMTGSLHPNWKPVKKNSPSVSIRTSDKYHKWRITIFRRDGFTCKGCGVVGGTLQVDHYPVTFAEILETFQIKTKEDGFECEALWDMENARTLCIGCHKKTDTWGRTRASMI